MPIRFCDGDEWYPVFSLREKDYRDDPNWKKDRAAEFTDDELTEYERAVDDFDRWQHIIACRFGYSHISNGVPADSAIAKLRRD